MPLTDETTRRVELNKMRVALKMLDGVAADCFDVKLWNRMQHQLRILSLVHNKIRDTMKPVAKTKVVSWGPDG